LKTLKIKLAPLIAKSDSCEKLHSKDTKSWIAKRHKEQARQHYYQTASQVQSDNYVDEMFRKLDSDGGGTLSVNEIHSMFVENGINMT
jgi:Ca2+-binding EF-hand superfamily protein